jgi:squalene synthase HpnC
MASSFAAELSRYGPDASYAPVSATEARAYCSRLARTHYENFTVASFLLPRHLLPHFHHVYAYCRWADDLGDETNPDDALPLLAWWRRELLQCYEGHARHPVMVALRETIERFRIPPQPFLDLLIAFEQDQRIKRYETYEQLLGYCRNSANPVGHLVLYLGECFTPENASLSDHVCTALQLTNFWQDVNRDLDIGRVYLPAEDRTRFGYLDADLEARRFTPEFAALLRYEVDRARQLFERGRPLLQRVPANLRVDICLFMEGGLATLRKIEEAGYDVWRARPKLSKWDKGKLLLAAMWERVVRRG